MPQSREHVRDVATSIARLHLYGFQVDAVGKDIGECSYADLKLGVEHGTRQAKVCAAVLSLLSPGERVASLNRKDVESKLRNA
jgi:hypothetical protein